MPRRHEWLSRIKAIEREYIAMRQAADYFLRVAREDPNILLERLKHAEIARASENLEGTYIIRIFAEFEAGARLYWAATWKKDPKRTVDLLNGIAARCGIPTTQRNLGHRVREYRNHLVHEREREVEGLSITDARGYLCRFFSFLPHRW